MAIAKTKNQTELKQLKKHAVHLFLATSVQKSSATNNSFYALNSFNF